MRTIRDVWVVFRRYTDYDGWDRGSPQLMGVYSNQDRAERAASEFDRGFIGGNTYIRGTVLRTDMEEDDAA